MGQQALRRVLLESSEVGGWKAQWQTCSLPACHTGFQNHNPGECHPSAELCLAFMWWRNSHHPPSGGFLIILKHVVKDIAHLNSVVIFRRLQVLWVLTRFISPILRLLQSTSQRLSCCFDIHFRAKESAPGAWFIPPQGTHLKQVREITPEKCLFCPLLTQEFSWGACTQNTAPKRLKLQEAKPTFELISPKRYQSSSLKHFEAGNYLGWKALGGLLLRAWKVIDILETQFQWKALHTARMLPGGRPV